MSLPQADYACLTSQQFVDFLLTELPVFSREILRDVTPTDMLAAHISSGSWEAFQGVKQIQDRFRGVWPNTTAKWYDVTDGTETCADQCSPDAQECVAACDPPMNEIGWGYERVVYGQKQQSWKSQTLCFDQLISATKAVEHLAQIVSDILRPASAAITSDFVRRENLNQAFYKKLADANMSDFTYTWETDGGQEIFMTPSALPTSKITPEMLQRQVQLLRNNGYFGKWTNDPFWGGYDSFIEFITDDDTAWELDRLATNAAISNQWRYQVWSAAHEYFKYGMGGQLGNYMIHVDPFPMRFNLAADGVRLQRVLPYTNEATTVGIGRVVNEDYLNARYQLSVAHHRFSWQLLTQRMEQVNPLMPFMSRDLSGVWNFATNDLGQDCDGNAIANFRKNKGFFYADWRLSPKPQHTEWEMAILHLREPRTIYVVEPCSADPGYPTQDYNSANTGCATLYVYYPQADSGGDYVLDANSVTCGQNPVANGAISESTLANLATALNNDVVLGAVGTWAAYGSTGISLSDSTCEVVFNWQV